MLGWEVFVYRHDEEAVDNLIARWKTSAFGLKWIDELVAQGKAHDHGGSGYPCIFTAVAGEFLSRLTSGLPLNGSPVTLGDDYVLPAGWNGELALFPDRIRDCDPGEELLIHAWDQS
jgi:hypothetical protein